MPHKALRPRLWPALDRRPTLHRVFLYCGLELFDCRAAAVVARPDLHAGRPAKCGHLWIAIPAPSCHCADMAKLDTGLGVGNEFIVGSQRRSPANKKPGVGAGVLSCLVLVLDAFVGLKTVPILQGTTPLFPRNEFSSRLNGRAGCKPV